MKFLLSTTIALGVLVLFGQSVSAQTTAAAPAPAPVPEAMPFDIPFGEPVTLEQAKKLAATAEAEAKKHNWKMACAVVEPSGDLVFFQKIDGTQYASIAISQGKAKTSATLRRATKVFQDQINAGQPAVLSFPGLVGTEGGVPLIEKGKLIGAIGCSGGSSQQDGVVANAAAATLK